MSNDLADEAEPASVSWLFFVVLGPLMVASFTLCGEDSSIRIWKSSFSPDLDRAERRVFSSFIRSGGSIPDDPRVASAALAWADLTLRRLQCRWERYLNWAWVGWISAGVVTALAFGSPRDVAIHLIVFNALLLVIVAHQATRRRAAAILVSAGRTPSEAER